MRLLVVLGALGFLLVPASSLESARPPALLTYGISYGPLGPGTFGGGLCLARSDGSRAVRLTGRRDDREPAWSPKGRFVAFTRQTTPRERQRRDGTVFDIHIADARGRILGNLTDGFAIFNTHAAWSPDGRRLAFAMSWRGSQVAVIGLNGRNMRVVARNASHPEWSHDGQRLAFTTYADDYYLSGPRSIESARLDGTDRRLIVENAYHPDFSPNGRRLAFIRDTGGSWETEVFIANADGSDAKALTSSPATEFDTAWSPDGRLLAITRFDAFASKDKYWIVVVRSDTGAEVATIRGPQNAFDPAWRPAVNLPRAKRRPCR